MKQPTLFLMTIPKEDGLGKSVLFPVLAKGNRVTFVAAAHTVTAMTGKHYKMIIADSNGLVVPRQETESRTRIVPLELGMDLAFIEMTLPEVPVLVRLSEQSILKPTILSHARNLMYHPDFKDQIYDVSEQQAAPLNRRYTRSGFAGGSFLEASEQREVMGKSFKNPLRTLRMQSLPGVSGSPLWDKYGNVLGMVCGGNEKLTPHEPEFILVYLPARTIKKAMATFLR